jgi:hypothetical protein
MREVALGNATVGARVAVDVGGTVGAVGLGCPDVGDGVVWTDRVSSACMVSYAWVTFISDGVASFLGRLHPARRIEKRE